ncbi:phosphatase [Limibacter armeniacum]|uniref:Ppx/GppA phosphatase family protein n=1 Tax=Limibacter armeniacum TaxID=466084 RepID=UPI002FE5F5EA
MILASIDIGSNAIRLQVVNAHENYGDKDYKRVEYIRFPLRLGQDVFKVGKITRATEEKFVKLMKAFTTLMDIYEVDDYMACATSAMREAENGKQIIKRIYYQHGLKIDIIDGSLEAEIINMSLKPYLPDGNALHIDVGGGSTELNIYHNREKIAGKSFKIGSVRSGNLTEEERAEKFSSMEMWVHAQDIDLKGNFKAIGTGGNINKLFSMSPQSQNVDKTTTITNIQELQEYIGEFTYEERIKELQLNKDRADVIIPASEIYINCMEMVNAKDIIVPGVGMKDGILKYMKAKMEGY